MNCVTFWDVELLASAKDGAAVVESDMLWYHVLIYYRNQQADQYAQADILWFEYNKFGCISEIFLKLFFHF